MVLELGFDGLAKSFYLMYYKFVEWIKMVRVGIGEL